MDYSELKGLNQSLLKKILKHPQEFIKEQKRLGEEAVAKNKGEVIQPKEHLVEGTLLDYLITETPEKIKNSLYISENNEKLPSETIQNIIEYVYNQLVHEKINLDEVELKELNDLILKAVENFNYLPTYKKETKINRIIESGNDYFEKLIKSRNKIIITRQQYNNAVQNQIYFNQNETIKNLIMPSKGVEIFKKPLYHFVLENLLMKGEGDLLVINHNLKLITPVDIKGIKGIPEIQFVKSFIKYNYPFQGEFYRIGIRMSEAYQDLIKDGYKIDEFKFIVFDRSARSKPIITDYDDDIKKSAIRKIKSAIARFKFHEQHNNWDHTAEYLTEGKLTLRMNIYGKNGEE